MASIWLLALACVSPVALPLFEVATGGEPLHTVLVGGNGICIHADASRPTAWTCFVRLYGGVVDGAVPPHAVPVVDAIENTRNALRIVPFAILAAYIIWPSLTGIMWLMRRRKRRVAGRSARKRVCSAASSNMYAS